MMDIVERLESINHRAFLGETIYRDAALEIEALRAENARLADKLKSVTEHRDFLLGRNVDPTMERADRYWEARWRDEAAENARLTKERDNALHRAAEYRDKCNQLWNDNNLLRAGRAAMGESDE